MGQTRRTSTRLPTNNRWPEWDFTGIEAGPGIQKTQITASQPSILSIRFAIHIIRGLIRLHLSGGWMSFVRCLLLALLLTLAPLAVAQNSSLNGSYFGTWFERVSHTQAEQPHWITPMFTTTPSLEEEVRYDIGRQNTTRGDLTNYGGGKGLEFIPSERTEIIVSPPPYLAHQNPALPDGFGDTSFLLKYRLVAGNEQAGNYIVTAFLGGSIPTGSYSNGAENAVVTPTIALGK